MSKTAGLARYSCATVAWCALLLTGCVERRMTIRSEPPGALVEVDGQPIGFAPASTGFTYYAPRKVRLTLDDYETLTVIQEVPAPWWDSLPFEFFTEHLVPFTFRDERTYTYTMPPRQPVTTEQVLGRGQQLRDEAHISAEPTPEAIGPRNAGTLPF